MNNRETMKQMVLAGIGLARLGLCHVAAEIAEGRLVPLLEDCNPGDFELIHATMSVADLYPTVCAPSLSI